VYLIAGATIFKFLEADNGIQEREDYHRIKIEMQLRYGINDTSFNEFIRRIKFAVDDGYSEHSDFDRWSFFGALFFAATVVTTIGYGHLAPRTFGGQLFCMIYAFFGIPITGLMLKSFGERLMDTIDMLIVIADKKVFKVKEERGTALRTSLILFMIMASMILVLAGVSMRYEGWTYFEGVYFAFITLSTIGFGDFVPTTPHVALHDYTHAHVALFVFISFIYITMGLSVVSSVLVSISRIFEVKTEWDFISLKEDYDEYDDENDNDAGFSSPYALEEKLRQQEPPQKFFLNQ